MSSSGSSSPTPKKPSKNRHLFGSVNKAIVYDDIKAGSCFSESNHISANKKYFAIPWMSMSPSLGIWPLEQKGRTKIGLKEGQNILSGHQGKITDFAFHPFDENVLLTASDDSTIKLWKVPQDVKKLTLGTKDFTSEYLGEKRVNTIYFHPIANNLLAAIGGEKAIRLWDLESNSNTEVPIGDVPWSMSWNFNGTLFVSTATDKKLRLCDPRAGKVESEVETSNLGTRGFRSVWKSNNDLVMTIGFSKSSDRQIQLWDLKNLVVPVTTTIIDASGSSAIPIYDEALSILYIGSRSDSNLKLYEISSNGIEGLVNLDMSTPLVGLCGRHKTECDVRKHQVMSFYMLTQKSVNIYDVFAPRKSDYFQDDLYPPTIAYGVSTLSAKDWLSGMTEEPEMVNLKPDDMKSQSEMNKEEGPTVLKPKYNFKDELSKVENTVQAKNEQKVIDTMKKINRFDEEDTKRTPIDDDW